MKNILLLDGSKSFGHSGGLLNKTLHNHAKEVLQNLGYSIQETLIDEGYEPSKEVEKILWADCVIHQMPGWWMGEPWIVKKYLDEVFTQGHGSLYANDGRTRSDKNKKYGSGGLLKNKYHMLSLTWNAPLEAFEQEDQFFGGVGVDGVYLHFHKAHEFLGFKALKTFICNDVIKNPQVDQYKKDYQAHLESIFGKAK